MSHPPVRGQPDLDWVVGVTSDGALAVDGFDGPVRPHLFLAGSAGTGITTLIVSMVTQLARNNDPDDVRFDVVCTTGELDGFARHPHVDRYMSPWHGREFAEDPAGEFCRLLDGLVDEVYRRNASFVAHPVRTARGLTDAGGSGVTFRSFRGGPAGGLRRCATPRDGMAC